MGAFLITISIVFPISVLGFIMRINWYNKFGDTNTSLANAIYYLGWPVSTDQRRFNAKQKYRISFLYAFMWPIVYIVALNKFFYEKIIGEKREAIKQKKYLEKNLFSPTDIYWFKPGDMLLTKEGKTLTLVDFTLTEFSDYNKNVYPWNIIKENSTFLKRKEHTNMQAKWKIFNAQAQEFKAKYQAFQKELDDLEEKKIDLITKHTKGE